MRFANYIFLMIIPLYAITLFFLQRRKHKGDGAFLFSDVGAFDGVARTLSVRIAEQLPRLRGLAVMLILVALARPQLLDVQKSGATFGIDIILSLDVSGSMRAEDFKPNNRLFVAKEVLKEFIAARSMDRLGLVVFAGKSYTQAPLTTDYSILLNVIGEVGINDDDKGTAIGLAVSESLNRLKDSTAKSKVIIMLTDGENNKGSIDPILSAKLAKALGVKLYTIGIGSGAGVPIPLHNNGGEKRYATSSDGAVVITKLNEDVLKRMAKIGGGHYYRATSKKALSEIYAKIGEMEKSEIAVEDYLSYYELFPFFAFAALLLLFIEVVLTTTKYSVFP